MRWFASSHNCPSDIHLAIYNPLKATARFGGGSSEQAIFLAPLLCGGFPNGPPIQNKRCMPKSAASLMGSPADQRDDGRVVKTLINKRSKHRFGRRLFFWFIWVMGTKSCGGFRFKQHRSQHIFTCWSVSHMFHSYQMYHLLAFMVHPRLSPGFEDILSIWGDNNLVLRTCIECRTMGYEEFIEVCSF